jgi:hypothetical protein
MKLSIFPLIALLFTSVLLSSQNTSQGDKHNDLEHKRIAITGCLTKNSLKEFELVDQEGIDNLPYSATINLDKYVGHTVTLIGKRSATPTVDGGASAKPHFQVSKVESASAPCKK